MPQLIGSIYTPFDTRYNNPMFNQQSGAYGYTAPSQTSVAGTSTSGVPAPQSGVPNPFGMVPGNLSMPNPSGDLASQLPNLSGNNSALSSDIYAKLNGYLSPSTTNAIQNHFGGTFGIQSGMPGSGLSWNNVYGNLIGAAENQRQQGIQDYSSAIPTVSGTQTVNPGLQTQIQQQNAVNAATPNPTIAGTYAQNLFNQYLQQMRGPAGGTGSRANNPTDPNNPFGLINPSGGTGSGALGFGFGTLKPSTQTALANGSFSPDYNVGGADEAYWNMMGLGYPGDPSVGNTASDYYDSTGDNTGIV